MRRIKAAELIALPPPPMVRMPTEEGERRVLVDCGFHS